MEKAESIRERLLSRLPQTDDVAAYKEEVAVLLAKHKRALYWEGMASKAVLLAALVIYSLGWWVRAKGINPNFIFSGAALFFLVGTIYNVTQELNRSQVGLLKEIKQVQVQVLELQASMRESDGAEL